MTSISPRVGASQRLKCYIDVYASSTANVKGLRETVTHYFPSRAFTHAVKRFVVAAFQLWPVWGSLTISFGDLIW